jgi:hypothetical protein
VAVDAQLYCNFEAAGRDKALEARPGKQWQGRIAHNICSHMQSYSSLLQVVVRSETVKATMREGEA